MARKHEPNLGAEVPAVPPGSRQVTRGAVDLDELRRKAQAAKQGADMLSVGQQRAPSGYTVHKGNGGWVYGVKGEGPGAEVMVLVDPRSKEREAFRVRPGADGAKGPYEAIISELFPVSEATAAAPTADPAAAGEPGGAAPALPDDPRLAGKGQPKPVPVPGDRPIPDDQDAMAEFKAEKQGIPDFTDAAMARRQAVNDTFGEIASRTGEETARLTEEGDAALAAGEEPDMSVDEPTEGEPAEESWADESPVEARKKAVAAAFKERETEEEPASPGVSAGIEGEHTQKLAEASPEVGLLVELHREKRRPLRTQEIDPKVLEYLGQYPGVLQHLINENIIDNSLLNQARMSLASFNLKGLVS